MQARKCERGKRKALSVGKAIVMVGNEGRKKRKKKTNEPAAADDAEVLDSQFVRSMRRELEIDCVADREYFLM